MSATALVLRDEVFPRPPVAPGLPLLGASLAAYRDPFRLFADAYLATGPVFRVLYPGRDMVMIGGLEANELFARQGRRLFDMASTYRRVTAELGSDRYPNAHDGNAHRDLRRALSPSLSAQAVDPFLPLLHAEIEQVASTWPRGPVPLRRVVGPLVADLVALISTNQRMGPGLARDAALYGSMVGIVGVGGAFPDFTLRAPPVQAARRRLEAFLLEALAAHRAKGPGLRREPDLLDALLAADSAQPDRVLLAQAIQPAKNAGIYLYRLVSFVLHAILRDRDLLEGVRAEVDLVHAWGPPDLAGLKRMTLLEQVILEALRRYPMALALPRVVAEPFDFAGHRFSPGTTVYIAGPATHFVPDFFPDPDRFDAARMGPGRTEHRRPHAFVPFGGGAHACLARGFSIALAQAVVGGLLRRLDLALPPGQEVLRVRGLPVPIPEARFTVEGQARPVPPVPREARSQQDEGAPYLLIGLSAAQRDAAFEDIEERTLAPGEVLFRPGDPAESFYVVRHGAVLVEEPEEAGVPRNPVQRFGPGEYLGARGLLQAVRRATTARADPEHGAVVLALGRVAYGLLAVECDLSRGEVARLIERRQAMVGLARVLPRLKLERLRRLGALCETESYPPGRAIVRQGEAADRFYVLIEGTVEVLGRLADGTEVPLAELAAPDCFGEIGLLEGRPRSATVRARSPVKVLAMDGRAFDALVKDTSGTGVDLARVASERLAELSARSS